ncbi:MAG: glutamate-5-semialdehyde dehydrogenase [SAR116 cluster bacterium]|nr:MAG: glutamate-5-semialdehyde dehydrogenase [SAR116 cluster bacterium]HBQ23324.1 glutamate-5-semialdehyde dehydrogenase [Alphaproteobacteria bacterium]|tara:strand:+ start:902 stop:2167 length:1266 start_codon:yes stop_codon:yes gene_type:complete
MDNNNLHDLMLGMGRKARDAMSGLANMDDRQRSLAIGKAALSVRNNHEKILEANQRDVDAALSKGLTAALVDRLRLDVQRIESMVSGLQAIAALPNPVGRDLGQWTRPNGLALQRISVPLGVIGIIYESRPNVTADAAGLCLKSANACILRGGSESAHSNKAIHDCFVEGLAQAGVSADAVQLVPTTDRAAVGHMLADMGGLIDVIVPRGGKSLVERVQREARVPVFAHLEGICHSYVHQSADLSKALAVTFNAKMRRTGICGATETLLVDEAIAADFLPRISARLLEAGCELRGCPRARAITSMNEAHEEDWDTEYLAPILSIKVVDDLAEALTHVQKHSSGHTEAIIAEDQKAAEIFLAQIDSAIVMHNASTQFADGGEFGFGAEIGIATGRIHARGPVGVEQLTSFKYQVRGQGQVRP